MFFAWIRQQVRNAVIGGISDALDHMNSVVQEQPTEPPVVLRLTMTSDPEAEAPGKAKKRSVSA